MEHRFKRNKEIWWPFDIWPPSFKNLFPGTIIYYRLQGVKVLRPESTSIFFFFFSHCLDLFSHEKRVGSQFPSKVEVALCNGKGRTQKCWRFPSILFFFTLNANIPTNVTGDVNGFHITRKGRFEIRLWIQYLGWMIIRSWSRSSWVHTHQNPIFLVIFIKCCIIYNNTSIKLILIYLIQ